MRALTIAMRLHSTLASRFFPIFFPCPFNNVNINKNTGCVCDRSASDTPTQFKLLTQGPGVPTRLS